MSLHQVGYGDNAPDEVNVIIEIPAQSDPVKYEVDKDSGALFVDRFLNTPMFYPCNYGYVPKTLSDDGDPVDVLVLTPVPLISGAVIPARPIGLLKMTDESGVDAKILAVPKTKLCPMYAHINNTDDVNPQILDSIKHFFEHYKDLEPNKWVKVDGWENIDTAKQEIITSIANYDSKGE